MPIQTISERRVRDAYGMSLLFVVGSIFVSIAVGDGTVGTLAAGLLQLLALLSVLQVTQASTHFVWFARVAGVTAAVLAGALTVAPAGILGRLVPMLWAVIVLGVMATILRHLATYTSVTVQAVLGLVTVYLLLGLFFAYLFMTADVLGSGFFAGAEKDPASFVYFSYVTLATVGYGDLRAAAGLPRALAVLEAVLGQLYLVTVVALAVGRVGTRRAGD